MQPWTQWAGVGLTIAILGVSASAAVSTTETDRYQGQFQIVVACDFDQGVSEDEYWFSSDEGERFFLHFDNEVEIPPAGSHIEFDGDRTGRDIHVVDVIEVSQPRGLGNETIGEQRICVLLINFQNDQRENVTPQQVATHMFGAGSSASVYWQQASFGKTWATGDVYGWYTLPINSGCDPGLWRSLAIDAADPDVFFPDYNRLFLLMPEGGGCGWGGLGTLGVENINTDDGVWQTSTSWCRSEYYTDLNLAIMITAHEGGHNLGQHHARSAEFAGEALGPFDCGGCGRDVSEYGDRLDSLGLWDLGLYNTDHKINLGWFNEGNVVTVTEGGVYAIDPFEVDSTEPKVLKVFRGHGQQSNRDEWLYLEWRQPIGYDANIDYVGGHNFTGPVFHFDWGENSTATYLLDMTPGDGEWLNPALPAGTSWSDNYTRLTIEPIGESNGKMLIDISWGELDPQSITVLRGTLLEGDATSVQGSDDTYLKVRSGRGDTAVQPFVTETQFNFQAQDVSPTTLAVEIESRIDEPAGIAQVLVKNMDTGDFDLVDTYAVGPSDDRKVISGLDATTYRNANNGRIRVRVRHIVVGTFFSFNFESWFDEVGVMLD